jgi:hypothetical protein
MAEDLRQYYTFRGIYPDDWSINWGGTNWHYLLVEDALDTAASVTTSTAWTSAGVRFLYPHNIKRTYYLEGVVEGHITFGAPAQVSHVSDYKVTVIKVHEDTTETELATTGVIAVNDTLAVNDEIVYPFWIDVFTSGKEITQNERIGIKIEWDVNNSSTVTAVLLHDYTSSIEDIKISLPFIL